MAHSGGVLLTGDGLFFSQRQRIAEIALETRLPAIFAQREYVEAGGLMSYGESLESGGWRIGMGNPFLFAEG
jgi:putative tryptophan/tyrosine transport system substrate-binding protein